MRHHAGRPDRQRRDRGRLLRSGEGHPSLYSVWGNPAKFIKERFDEELTGLLMQFRWWDLKPEELAEALPLMCDPDVEKVRQEIRARVHSR